MRCTGESRMVFTHVLFLGSSALEENSFCSRGGSLMWDVCREGWGGLLFLFRYLTLSHPQHILFWCEKIGAEGLGSFRGSHYQVAPNSLPIALGFMTLGVPFVISRYVRNSLQNHSPYTVWSIFTDSAIKTVCHITKPLCIPNLKYSLKSLSTLFI